VNSKKNIYSCHSFLSFASQKKAPNIPFCYLLSIYPKRGLGALLKKEERKRERERKKSKRKRTNVPIKKTLSH
jgi:hypothetical protein